MRKEKTDLAQLDCTFISLSIIFLLTTDTLKFLKTNGSKSQQTGTCISACLWSLTKVTNL